MGRGKCVELTRFCETEKSKRQSSLWWSAQNLTSATFAPGSFVEHCHLDYCCLTIWSLICFVFQESNSSQGLFFRVDKYGFFLGWREEDKVDGRIACSLATTVVRNSASSLKPEIRLYLQCRTMFWEILTCLNEIFKILVTDSGCSPSFLCILGRELFGFMSCEWSPTRRYSQGWYSLKLIFNKAWPIHVLSSQNYNWSWP